MILEEAFEAFTELFIEGNINIHNYKTSLFNELGVSLNPELIPELDPDFSETPLTPTPSHPNPQR